MSLTFTKLFSSITESTVWMLPADTRLVWITMLAMADRNGLVFGSVPGLAHRARVSLPACELALATFLAPDKFSRTSDFEGRRIESIDGGWRLLNHAKYRGLQDAETVRESKRDYMRRQRKSGTVTSTNSTVDNSPLLLHLDLSSESGLDPDPDSARGQTMPARYFTLEGWVPSDELRAEAAIQGVPPEQFDARLAELGNGPIGGKRGVLNRDSYVRQQFPKWRMWSEQDRANAISRAGRGPRSDVQASPGTPQPSHVPARLIAFCAEHSLDCPALLAAHLRGGAKWESASDQSFWSEFAKRLATAAKEKPNAPIKRNGRPDRDRQEHGAPPQPDLQRRNDSLLGVPEDGGAPAKPALPIVPGSGVAPAERARPAVRATRADRGGQE